jgi:hypothetical protein
MKKVIQLFIIFAVAGGFQDSLDAKTFEISHEELFDRIKGAWAAQVIGVTFGGPTEFQWNSTIIPDYVPIEWTDDTVLWWFQNRPGLYDDIYMDLTFVQVFEEQGLDAPASEHAKAFAHAEYPLWHANQMARYNILNGIMPPESGHWLNNPHADDIDYEIEADFAGIMSPGMPVAAAEICDTIGHIMNYGDGYYGGVFVAALYANAFTSDDVHYVVREALQMIPKESDYHKTIRDVIRFHEEYPDDWKQTWFEIQQRWGQDVGCPDGVFTPFNIDAKMNSAWIVLGLLYGEGDFGKTFSIATRAGDDSDCNPANAGGVLGAMYGYDAIPEYWKQGLNKVENMDFKFTTISMNDLYQLSLNHAMEMIRRNGGSVENGNITISIQNAEPVPLEIGFEGHYPVARERLNRRFHESTTFEFHGIGFAVTGSANSLNDENHTLEVAMYIDGEHMESANLPTAFLTRRNTPFWKYQLPRGDHQVTLKIRNSTSDAEIHLRDLIVYDDEPSDSEY